MDKFKLKKYGIEKSEFQLHPGADKQKQLELSLSGGVSIDEQSEKSKVAIKLTLSMGGDDDLFYLSIKTFTIFDVVEDNFVPIREDIDKDCLPIALQNVRRTVEELSKLYGIGTIEIPPFDKEFTN